jgi:hypothetical protein
MTLDIAMAGQIHHGGAGTTAAGLLAVVIINAFQYHHYLILGRYHFIVFLCSPSQLVRLGCSWIFNRCHTHYKT